MAEFVHVYNDGGGIRNVPMREGATRFTTDRVLYQAGVTFCIPPGDGGANGLSFTGTNGNFTLSAAVDTDFWRLFIGGGYMYFPSGITGLSSGWRWVVMTTNTDGVAYAETYVPGVSSPPMVKTPTPISGVGAGRITQVITEITAHQFILPGKSLGPNGALDVYWARDGDTTAGKTLRLRLDGTLVITAPAVSTAPSADQSPYVKNMGVETRQLGVRSSGYGAAGGTGVHVVSTIDTSVDVTATITMQLSQNTGALALSAVDSYAKYGA